MVLVLNPLDCVESQRRLDLGLLLTGGGQLGLGPLSYGLGNLDPLSGVIDLVDGLVGRLVDRVELGGDLHIGRLGQIQVGDGAGPLLL